MEFIQPDVTVCSILKNFLETKYTGQTSVPASKNMFTSKQIYLLDSDYTTAKQPASQYYICNIKPQNV